MVIVRLIGLLALDELEYTEVVQEIINANPGIEDYTVLEVWKGIVRNIFYEPLEMMKQKKLKEAS